MCNLHVRQAVAALFVAVLCAPVVGQTHLIVSNDGTPSGASGCVCGTERYADTSSGVEGYATRYNGQKWGFAFTTSQADSICGVTIDINLVGSNANSLIEVRFDDDSLMETEYTQSETKVITAAGEATFTFDPEISVSDATTYYVFFTNDSTDWDDRIEHVRLTSNTAVDWWQANDLPSTWDQLSVVDTRTPYYRILVCD